jgi:hypothetical protein
MIIHAQEGAIHPSTRPSSDIRAEFYRKLLMVLYKVRLCGSYTKTTKQTRGAALAKQPHAQPLLVCWGAPSLEVS